MTNLSDKTICFLYSILSLSINYVENKDVHPCFSTKATCNIILKDNYKSILY